MSKPIHILLVEDNDSDAELLQEALKNTTLDYVITRAVSLKDAKSMLARTGTFQLILLDLDLPDSQGLHTVESLAFTEGKLPIIIMTGNEDETLAYTSIKLGVQDYLVKGRFTQRELEKSIRYACYRLEVIHKINEVSEQEKAYLATHNALTGLPCEKVFYEQVQNIIAKYKVCRCMFGLVVVRFSELQEIEKQYGMNVRDKIVKKLAATLREASRSQGNLYQLTYNEFAILIEKMDSVDMLSIIIRSIQQQLNYTIKVNACKYTPAYSMGGSIYPFDGVKANKIILSAKMALEQARHKGYREFEIFNDSIHQPKYRFLHTDILTALSREEFFVFYQPQMDLKTGKLFGLEALLRWNHPKFGVVNPGAFIPVAEAHKLITPIGLWVIQSVCKQINDWREKCMQPLNVSVNANVSIQQLQYSNLEKHIDALLNEFKIPPGLLGIELTESIFLSEPELVIKKLHELKQLGVKVAIDDFGKGYSSLSYLTHLPLDYLKLDIDFVKDIHKDEGRQTIVAAIIRLAHELGMKVVAEGVEEEAQYLWLQDNQCDAIQGYYYSKPASAKEIERHYIKSLQVANR